MSEVIMSGLPKIIESLSDIEKIDVKDFKFLDDEETAIEVIAKDGREYFVFYNTIVAKKIAADIYKKTEDDPQVYEDLEAFGKTIEEYAPVYVDMEGAEKVLSYDGCNRIKLPGSSVAYRSM